MTYSGLPETRKTANKMSALRRVFAVLAMLFGVFLAYLFFWPVPIDPVANEPFPPNPAGQGVFAANQKLDAAELLTLGPGPEGIAFDAAGNLYT